MATRIRELPEPARQIALKRMDDMIKMSIWFRGKIIEHFTSLETIMEVCISRYFANDRKKSEELNAVLIMQEGFNFHNKRRMVIFVMKNGFPSFYNENKKLDKELQKLNAFRNVIAHRKLKLTINEIMSFDDKNLKLISLSTSDNDPMPKEMILNAELIQKEAKRIDAAMEKLSELYELINKL